ncbi:MAG: transglutaminase-like domain-containing protein, partial [Thermoguttaceae bacterium]
MENPWLRAEKERNERLRCTDMSESLSADRVTELLEAMRQSPLEHRQAMSLLVKHMPKRDLRAVDKTLLLENVRYSYLAREETPWGPHLPDELFFNYVLPYANLTEARDHWRRNLYPRCREIVQPCRTPGEAAVRLNEHIFDQLNVTYHATKRPWPDQSPSESIRAGYASCTGLAILLVDACRSVCVPARIVGVPRWNSPEPTNNHTWVEIWDGQWHFLEPARPGPFDQAWFLSAATKAQADCWETSIYAASFLPAETWFVMVWALGIQDVPA